MNDSGVSGDGNDTPPGAGDGEESGHSPIPLTRRVRLRSAALWGAAAALTFLVLAQGYLILGGSLPIRYTRLFALGVLIGAVAGVTTYATEHRLTAKRRV